MSECCWCDWDEKNTASMVVVVGGGSLHLFYVVCLQLEQGNEDLGGGVPRRRVTNELRSPEESQGEELKKGNTKLSCMCEYCSRTVSGHLTECVNILSCSWKPGAKM